jgi:hypothetical protein
METQKFLAFGEVEVIDPETEEVWYLQVAEADEDGDDPNVNVSRLGAFPEKTVIGDYTKADHPYLSGVATLDSRWPHGLCLMPEVVEVTGPNDDGVTILGDITYNGTRTFWVAWGDEVTQISGTTVEASADSLIGTPVTKGAPYRGSGEAYKQLAVPCGSDGYSVLDPATGLCSEPTADEFISFANFDRQLWGMTADGSIKKTATSPDGPWTDVCQIDGDGEPRGLITYIDQIGAPALAVITDRDVQFVDPRISTTYTTSLQYPPHRDAALAFERWREQLFVSYSVDVARYDGGTISYPGLLRDYGLPAEWQGRIKSMVQSWNMLYVLIEGEQESEEGGRLEVDIDPTELLFAGGTGRALVMGLDGLGGWHTVWASETSGGDVTNIYLSAADAEADRLWWGFNGNLYTTVVPRRFQAPLQNPTARFQLEGELESPWLDFNMGASHMILGAIEVTTKSVPSGTTVYVDYRTNDGAWVALGELTDAIVTDHGPYRFKVGRATRTLPNGRPWYKGEIFSRMKYRIRMGTDDANHSPHIRNVTILYMKQMETYESWPLRIKASYEEGNGYKGKTNAQIQAFIQRLLEERFVAMRFAGQDWRVVKIAGAGGPQKMGQRISGDREVQFLDAFIEDGETVE